MNFDSALFHMVDEALREDVGDGDHSTLSCIPANARGTAVLKIKDNGIGMDLTTASRSKSFGLLGIKERTFALGGKFDLKSVPGEGTQVCVSIPFMMQPRD